MTRLLAACLGVSASLHCWLASSIAQPPAPARARPVLVELSVPPPAAPPVATPAAPPPKPPAPAPRMPAKSRSPAAAEPVAAEPPALESAPELAGTTLAGELGAGWSAPPGAGTPRDAPIHAGFSRPPPATLPAVPAPAALPATLPLARLGRRPSPPALESALRRNYPARARSQGLGGDAKVRARVESSGRIREVSLLFESSPDFGEACRRTLLASRWTAPLDPRGRPVATWISYRCRFRVD